MGCINFWADSACSPIMVAIFAATTDEIMLYSLLKSMLSAQIDKSAFLRTNSVYKDSLARAGIVPPCVACCELWMTLLFQRISIWV